MTSLPATGPAHASRSERARWLGACACGFIAFVGIAYALATWPSVAALDERIALLLHASSTEWLTRAMLVVSQLHDTMAMLLASAVIAVALLQRGSWQGALHLVVIIGGGMLLNDLLKNHFVRARPIFADPIVTLSSYSFPSGHVNQATLFYGSLLLLVWSVPRVRRWRAAIALAAAGAVALVAFSRMYLGAHFFTDILAGFTEALTLLALGHALDPPRGQFLRT